MENLGDPGDRDDGASVIVAVARDSTRMTALRPGAGLSHSRFVHNRACAIESFAFRFYQSGPQRRRSTRNGLKPSRFRCRGAPCIRTDRRGESRWRILTSRGVRRRCCGSASPPSARPYCASTHPLTRLPVQRARRRLPHGEAAGPVRGTALLVHVERRPALSPVLGVPVRARLPWLDGVIGLYDRSPPGGRVLTPFGTVPGRVNDVPARRLPRRSSARPRSEHPPGTPAGGRCAAIGFGTAAARPKPVFETTTGGEQHQRALCATTENER